MKRTRRQFLASAAALAAMPKLHAQTPDLASDPRRPQFHLLPAHNWMNDPNGPIFFNGRYHMFFQYNPLAATWGDMSWNHAISPDMIHWTHLPVAMTPTPDSPDAFGCFSGTAIQLGSRVAFIYTGVIKSTPERATLRDGNNDLLETQCLAWSDNVRLLTWHKDPTPVIAETPPGLKITGFRDPSLWRQGDWYYMTVGSGIAETGGCVLLYRSTAAGARAPASGDLKHWEYMHPLTSGVWNGHKTLNACDDGEMWECPDFFALDGGHVLIYSTLGKVFWQSGRLDPASMRFTPNKSGLLDLDAFYAPKTQLDKEGRRILWGWIPERRSEDAMRQAGWSGMMSLPRVLNLDADGILRMSFLPELTRLRRAPTPQLESRSGILRTIPKATGELFVDPPGAQDFRLSLALADSTKLLDLTYSQQTHSFAIDGKELALTPADRPTVHGYIDGSVLELIFGGRYACTRRFYYPASTAPEILAKIDSLANSKMETWSIAPISPNRLTTPA